MRAWLRTRRGRWLSIVAVLVVLAMLNKAHQARPEVEVAQAAQGALQLTIAASGTVEGVASDLSFNETGRIVETYVREGDEIRQEQILSRIEPGVQLGVVAAPLDVIRAPFDGWVVNIYQYEGAVVGQGVPVLRAVRRGARWVTAYVDAEDAAYLHAGDAFTCRAGGYLARPWRLAVQSIGREAVQRADVPGSAKQVRVRLRTLDADFGLAAGTPVDVDGEVTIAASALLIPAAAVVRNNGAAEVWKLVDGRVTKVPVRTGANNFRQVAVLEGVAEGETVVVEGKARLEEGLRVRAKDWETGRK